MNVLISFCSHVVFEPFMKRYLFAYFDHLGIQCVVLLEYVTLHARLVIAVPQ